jgi:hypothetical protein
MVPGSLRGYFASEITAALIQSITKEAELAEPGAIAGVVYRLITKDLSAHDFIDGTSEQLGVSTQRAHAIARALKELVFEKVRNELFVWGIDISAINVVNAPSLDDIRIEERGEGENTPEPPGERTIKLDTVGTSSAVPQAVPVKPTPSFFAKKPSEGRSPAAPGAPLIIHEEKRQPAPPTVPRPKKFFFPMSFFKPKAVPQPVPAQIETKGVPLKPENAGETKRDQKKVVFYSESRTPLTPFSTSASSDVINLQTFKVEKREGGNVPAPQPSRPTPVPTPAPRPQAPLTQAPNAPVAPTAPRPPQPTPPPSVPTNPTPVNPERSQPKIDGNTIDLRNGTRS